MTAMEPEWRTCEHHWVWHSGPSVETGLEVAQCSQCGHIQAATQPAPKPRSVTGTVLKVLLVLGAVVGGICLLALVAFVVLIQLT